MSDKSFDMNEFISTPQQPAKEDTIEEENGEFIEELDVQKVVVEELAADKAELHEKIAVKDEEISRLKESVSKFESELAAVKSRLDEETAKNESLTSKIASLEQKLNEKLLKELDSQERNPNALALLDREMELPDRFPGETRDHVIEVIKEARDKAEAEGRQRRAQLLEGVLVANEPNGELANRRKAIEKLFKDNGNLVTGEVISTLEQYKIPYKDGESYLLPKEIILKTY